MATIGPAGGVAGLQIRANFPARGNDLANSKPLGMPPRARPEGHQVGRCILTVHGHGDRVQVLGWVYRTEGEMSQLRPSPEPSPCLEGVADGAGAVVANAARSISVRVPLIADRILEELKRTLPGYRHGLVPPNDLSRSVRENLDDYVSALSCVGWEDQYRFDRTRATGERRAGQQLPLEDLLGAFRLGGRVVWREMLRETAAENESVRAQLSEGGVLVWDMTERFSREVAESYRRAEWLDEARDPSKRGVLLQRLFDDELSDGVKECLPEMLGFSGESQFLVAVADVHGVEGSGPVVLTNALSSAGIQSIWVQRGPRLCGLIECRIGCSELLRACLQKLPTFHRIGLSPLVDSIARVPQAYRHAGLALNSIPPTKRAVVSLDDCLPDALVVANPDLAQRILHRAMPRILELDQPETDVLLETLRAYIDYNASILATAKHLLCHRNTVHNRLNRIEELTNLSVSNPSQLLTLMLALMAYDLVMVDSSGSRPSDDLLPHR